MDLTKAIASECKIDIIGIRPGEKIHEVLITEEEGRHAIDYDGMFVVLPNYSWWNQHNYKSGTKLPEGFIYASNTNDEWLSVEDLKGIIENYRNLFDTVEPSAGKATKDHDFLGNQGMKAEIDSPAVLNKKQSLAS
jgi:hypothetical protein